MIKVYSITILRIILCGILWITTIIIRKRTKKQNIQKSSRFECGFDPLSPMDHRFSMPFFIIALIFLLFDVEIILVIVKPLNERFRAENSSNSWILLIAITLCTLVEWKKGILKWI